MSRVQAAVGNVVAQWDDERPLKWELRETTGDGKDSVEVKVEFDLTHLLLFYSESFLLAIKKSANERPLKVRLRTVKYETESIRRILEICSASFTQACKSAGLFYSPIERIDGDFLVSLNAIQEQISNTYLRELKTLWTRQRANRHLFAEDLHGGDFPSGKGVRSIIETMRRSILSTALNRAALVDILTITEAAYEARDLDLGRYAFCRLLLCRAARPETFRVLKCKDLRVDLSGGLKAYFLEIPIPKTRTAQRPKASIRIPAEVGELLEQQRIAVSSRLGNLVREKNAALKENSLISELFTIGDLPMFPTPNRMEKDTKARLGMIGSSTDIGTHYINPLRDLTGQKMNCTAMRHTMGTQLAIAGCSAATIAAVLLHSTEDSAQIYTDLVFEGAIDKLSEAMEPAFKKHFPVHQEFTSTSDSIAPQQRIRSESVAHDRVQTTGVCGRYRACEQAPIVCYGCFKFRPAYDADHTINLEVVNFQISEAERGGLQRQVDVQRFKQFRNHIRVTIDACEIKRAETMGKNGARTSI